MPPPDQGIKLTSARNKPPCANASKKQKPREPLLSITDALFRRQDDNTPPRV
ncbi:hypothetical protein WH47_06136 [Habropoda laboriosa]|uniref:Uncharacterized protein n=1 Tax=Habropoda laboriosa TaxID=597456 RepID=A0A0L7RK56_9HYME|nr:hypothetical protein WH47_06136 [Habropoda laboriosa]